MNEQYANLLKEHGLQLPIIESILSDEDIKMFTEKNRKHFQRYIAHEDGVPILKRKIFATPFDVSQNIYRLDNHSNNCINRNFESDIVDTKVGYFAGVPITRSLDGESLFENAMTEWDKEQDIADKDLTTTKMAAITGIAYRLLYSDTEGNAHLVNLDQTEEDIIVLSTTSPSAPDFALRRYNVTQYDGEKIVSVERLEVYDDKNIITLDRKDGEWQHVETKLHLFKSCPLYAVINNDELQSDFEKVIPAIDAYNRTLSDASDEIENNRLAYLVLRGMGIDDEQIREFQNKSILELYDGEQNVEYLTKDVNDTMIENHLNRLERNIYKDAKSVDFSDEKFSGNSSGVALKYKNQGLENKTSSFERKFESMQRYQYMLLNAYWSEYGFKGTKVEPDMHTEIIYTYKRNLPEDLLEMADIQQKLKGVVSDRERLRIFVNDVDQELRNQREEQEQYYEDVEQTFVEPFQTDDDTEEV